mmetsp:Transcript_15969/g.36687  ORF Transcript_15969/g.36687 Transcript_15969/m.36687 type:complete len:105 (+) Transcript_15969:584-898(+)
MVLLVFVTGHIVRHFAVLFLNFVCARRPADFLGRSKRTWTKSWLFSHQISWNQPEDQTKDNIVNMPGTVQIAQASQKAKFQALARSFIVLFDVLTIFSKHNLIQ